MKQKNNTSSLVTKGYLDKSISNLLQGIRREFIFAIEGAMLKFEHKLTKHTSLILTTVNPLLKELETRREDREIASSQSARIKDKIDNHEKRIQRIEQIQQAT